MYLLKYVFLLAGFSLLMTSCELDPIDPIGEDDPTISVTGIPQSSIEVGSEFTVTVTTTPASTTQLLKSFTVREDNSIIPFSRMSVNGTAANSNPILLFNNDKSGFSWSVTIQASNESGSKEYTFEIEDDNGNKDNFSFDVNTNLVEPGLNVEVSNNIAVSLSALIALPLEITKGSYDLASIAVYENNSLIADLNRVAYDQIGAYFDTNPFVLPEQDQEGVATTLYLRVQDEPSTHDYSIVVSDVEGNTTSFDLQITAYTPVIELTGVLFNAGGPVNTGGLDLDEGISLGSIDDRVEIKDEGIDLDLPAASNWKRSISGANGSVVKQVLAGQNGLSEEFTYEDVLEKEILPAIFDVGVDFTLTNSEGELISPSVNTGDMFIVNNGDKYYLIIVRQVNVVTDSNADNYVMDIKQ